MKIQINVKESTMKRIFGLFLVVVMVSVAVAQEAQAKNPVRLQLPGGIYAVPGVEMNVYFDNIACTLTPGTNSATVTTITESRRTFSTTGITPQTTATSTTCSTR